MSTQDSWDTTSIKDIECNTLPQVLTVNEVALLLRVNRNTVYELFRLGEIPGGRRVGRSIRFSRDTVVQWLQGNQAALHAKGQP